MISVVVLTFNEEDRLKACLESVKWAGEIIIVDSNSTDKTLEIAKIYTSKIFQLNSDFASRRNLGMEKAMGDWVLYLDSDERVLEPLKQEILELVQSEDYCAYAICRKNIIFGKEVAYGFFWPDWMIKLFKKDKFVKWVGEVHEHGEFTGNLGYSKNPLLHLTHRDLDQIVLKSLNWSKIDASLRFKAKHPKMTSLRFLRILITETFKQGVLKRAFFSGTVATMDALLQVFSMVITYIRLWQLQQPKDLKEIYHEIDQKLIENRFK